MSDQKQADRPNDSIVEIRSVSKAFATRRVLKNIDLDIGRSQSVCLSGVNGAGKSTLMRIVAGLLHPDAGSVSLNGHDVRKEPQKTKPQLGVISHKSMVYPDLTVSENLVFFANLYGVKSITSRIAELLKDVGLFSYRYDKASVLSRGLLQRLAIARALVHQPSVLLADEPFTGLDWEASKYLIGVFANFTDSGGTIIMTTHDTHVGLQCCERVVVLDKHKLIFDAMTQEIDTAAFTKDYLSYARNSN